MNEIPETHILRIDCPDRPGIVAAVASTLRDAGCNIEESAQFNDRLSGRFFMRTVFRALENDGERLFIERFRDIGNAFGMDWKLNPSRERPKILILVSKADHCLNDILYRWRTGHLRIDIPAIASNHETCRKLAEDNGLRFEYLPMGPDGKDRQEEKLAALIEETGAELTVLARYMQVLSDKMCARYPGKIINIHHSFLPGFKGAKPYTQAWERGVKIIGATAHFVTADLDEGPIIDQQTIRIDHTMEPEKLQVLGQDIEAQVLSRTLLNYTERRIFLQGARTVIL